MLIPTQVYCSPQVVMTAPEQITWTWTKLPDGRDHRHRKITRYQSDTGWIVYQTKRYNGPGGDPRIDHNPSKRPYISYAVRDPKGKDRIDASATLQGAKLAAERRAYFDGRQP